MQEVTEAEASLLEKNGNDEKIEKSSKTTKKPSIYCLVREPEKVGDGMNAYVTYKVHTKGDNDKLNISVRRYSDFLWLHDRLGEEFIDVIIPPVPEKVIVNKTATDTVEYRRRELEKFLKRVLRHEKLNKSQYLKSFLIATEQDMVAHRSLKHVRPKIEEEKSFFSSSLSFITSVTGQADPVKEIDLEFDENKDYVNGILTQFEVLQAKANSDIEKTKELVNTLAEFSHAAELMSKCESSQDATMASFWTKLSQILIRMSELNDALSKNETLSLDNTLKDYIRISSAAKVTLENRVDILTKLQDAQKRNASSVTALDKELKSISVNVKEEMTCFKQKKSKDIRNALRALVAINIEHEQKVVALWKELLSELEEKNDM